MVTRIWHGRTKSEDDDLYLGFLLGKGTDEYRETDGNLSAKVWRKRGALACDFWTVTEWDDVDSVKAFAGEDFERAKYYAEDDGVLLEFEEGVNHYEVYDVSNGKVKGYMAEFERILHGGNWLAECFDGKLKGVSDMEAFTVVMPGVHCVAEIVWHCIYWRKVLLARLAGDSAYRDATLERFNFLSVEELKRKGWGVLKDELAESQVSILDFLRGKTDRFLLNEYEPGRSFDYLIGGTIQHDVYHLGQVGLVLRMVRG